MLESRKSMNIIYSHPSNNYLKPPGDHGYVGDLNGFNTYLGSQNGGVLYEPWDKTG
jgi:hypothetical protein